MKHDHLPSIRLDQPGITLDPLEKLSLAGLGAIEGKKQSLRFKTITDSTSIDLEV
jgi:hypothetical protein